MQRLAVRMVAIWGRPVLYWLSLKPHHGSVVSLHLGLENQLINHFLSTHTSIKTVNILSVCCKYPRILIVQQIKSLAVLFPLWEYMGRPYLYRVYHSMQKSSTLIFTCTEHYAIFLLLNFNFSHYIHVVKQWYVPLEHLFQSEPPSISWTACCCSAVECHWREL